ncbi:DUF6090 family protein [bacterium]|nr:DUF6090 family protein [bacterium]
MIKFFRKIRKQLLTENKFSKYLIYAMGEILLVMIGILLAFQVNSWNDQRKRDLLEIDILKELKQNLMVDIVDIDENISQHEQSLKSSQIISSVIENDLPNNDSLNNHFSNIILVPMFLPTKTAYENLKLTGTKILDNDSLRLAIIELYERKYAFLKDVVDGERVKMVKDLNGFYRNEFSSIDFFGKSYPVNFEELIKNQVYSNYVNYQKTISKFILVRYENTKEETNHLIIRINDELDNLD